MLSGIAGDIMEVRRMEMTDEKAGIKRDCHMKKLTAEQVLSVYIGVAKEHFPVAELKCAAQRVL